MIIIATTSVSRSDRQEVHAEKIIALVGNSSSAIPVLILTNIMVYLAVR